MNKPIEIYTDGACSGNPGPGGWGVLIIKDDLFYESGGAEEQTTNNIMELTAAIEALAEVSDEDRPIVVYTDSEYLRKGITQWIHLWKVNNWRKADKSEVKNVEFWQELDELNQPHIRWEWVKGHGDNPYNCRVDQIARAYAKGEDIELLQGEKPGPGFFGKNGSCRVKVEKLPCEELSEKETVPVPEKMPESILEPVREEIGVEGSRGESVEISGPVKSGVERVVSVSFPNINRFAETLGKKGFIRREAVDDVKYSYRSSDGVVDVDIKSSGLFLFRGLSDRVDSLSSSIAEADSRYFEKSVHSLPLDFPEDLSQWRSEHLESFLRPFFKKLVRSWKYDITRDTLTARDVKDPDTSFEIHLGEKFTWKVPPPESAYESIRKSAEAALEFEDRYSLGISFGGDSISAERKRTEVSIVLSSLSRKVLNLARTRNWDILSGMFDSLGDSEKLRIIGLVLRYLEPAGIYRITFSGSGENPDSEGWKKLDMWILESLKVFSIRAFNTVDSFGKIPLDLVIPGEEMAGSIPAIAHLHRMELHEKVKIRPAKYFLESCVVSLLRFITEKALR